MAKSLLLRDIRIPSVLLLLTNLLGFTHVLPISLQLIINCCCSLFIGCILATRLSVDPNGHLQLALKAKGEEEEVIDMKEAMKFPIVASAALLGIYLLFRFVDKEIVNMIISGQFCIATVISLTTMLLDYYSFSEKMRKMWVKIHPHRWIKSALDINDFEVSPASVCCLLICSIPIVTFFITGHWLLNNIFGVLFVIVALKTINLSSFKVGLVLLWALFFYDIFWVYGTDVMVTVAKNLKIPIKILFPYINAEGEEKFSLVGLGDIVIPGLYLSICFKFDVVRSIFKSKSTKVQEISLTYSNVACVSYFIGMIMTFVVMTVFDAAQPALLYLVPCCTLSTLALAFKKGEIQEYFNYETQIQKAEEKEEEKKLLKQDESKQT